MAGLGISLRETWDVCEALENGSLRRVLPGVVNLLTRMIKTTALAALIGVVDVVKVAQQVIELHPWASYWIYGILFMLYFLLCYPLSLLAARLERAA